MVSTIDLEINELECSNLISLIPDYLLNYFKDDFNDRIVFNLINELEIVIKSILANNSFKLLTLNNESKSKEDHLIDFIDLSSQLLEIFKKYEYELNAHNFRFNQLSLKHSFSFNNRNEILIYQRAILIEKLNNKHYDLLNILFKTVFDYYQKLNQEDQEQDETEQEDNDEDNLKKNILLEKFKNINLILFNLELFDHLCGDVVVEVLENKIRQHIENTSLDNYEETFINSFETWLDKIILGWIRLIYECKIDSNKFDTYLLNYKKQLAHFMYTNYAHIRIKRLFDIVIDFPDSKNAIEDLKICLSKTNLKTLVIKSLKQSIEQRLLHPGVNTSDILTAYVSAIKALMCLDPSGVMMENICEPLKKYLRNRDDTVKCIVSNLTDDGESSNDLMEEFCKDLYTYEGAMDMIDSNTAALIHSDNNSLSIDSKHSKSKTWRLWLPDPVDAPSDNTNDGSKSNIISMLVNIYGSKDMFVNEYKTLLGDRLLSNYSFNMEKEIRNLELLKLRFGESNLFACEAMLKDISESKRINANILEQLKQKNIDTIESLEVNSSTLKCLILSEQFWPKLKEEKIELPHELNQIQEKFMKSYEAFKGNRTLIWKNNLGQVNIEIEINKQTLEFNVTPIQAAVIIKFQEKDTWSIHDLAQSLKMCSFALKKKILFWKMNGLLKQIDAHNANEDVGQELYTLVKESSKLSKNKHLIELEDDTEKTAQKSEILKEQELNLYWNYTQSMLRGSGCLSLDRIHSWLKLYANPDITIEQVKYLLDLKNKEQLLKYNAGLYRLNK